MFVDGNLGEWYFDVSFSTYSFEENCNWVLVEGRKGLRPNRTERKQKETGRRRGYQDINDTMVMQVLFCKRKSYVDM
jgi:hypothetical protein